MSTFLELLLDHTKSYESPTMFWKWSGYASIAAVLRDNVWKNFGDKRLYPNIYVLFLAESGSRKGPPVDLSEQMLKEIGNTKCISGRSSIQGIVDELAHTETNSKTGQMLKGGSAIWYASELAAGIVHDDAAIAILTDIYEGKTDFKNILRHSPRFKVDRIVFNALLASNAAMLKNFYNSTATHGGLLARTFLITPSGEFRKSNSLLKHIDRSTSYKKCVDALKQLTQLGGEITFDETAQTEYDPWYEKFRMSYRNSDKGGIAGRLHTGVLKVAMILAANEESLIVRQRHIEEAISECIQLLPNYNEFIMASGKSTVSEAGAILLTDLQNAEGYMLDRRIVLRNHWQDIDSEILDKLTQTLESAGMIQTIMNPPTIYYRLTTKALEILGKGKKVTTNDEG